MPLNIYGEQTPENSASKLSPPPTDLGSNANPGGVPRRGLILGGQSVVGAPPAPIQSSASGSLYGKTQIPAIIPDTQLSNAYNPSVVGSQNDIISNYQSDLRTQQEQLQNLDNTFAQNYSNLPKYNPQEDYNTLFKTAGVGDLYGQQASLDSDLSKVRDAAKALEDQFNNLSQDQEGQGGFANIVAGRQARLSKELARRLQPLQRQEQLLVDRSNALTNRIKAVKDDITQQITLGQQNYQNTMSANDQKLKLFGLQRDAKSEDIKNTRENIKMVQDQLNKQLELAQKNQLDPLELIKTMIQVPEGISFKLSDGTTITGLKTDKPNVKQISEKDKNGRVVVVGLDELTGKELYRQDLGIISTPTDTGTDLSELLTPTEAVALRVPYGTTRGQAIAMGITPEPQPTDAQNSASLYADRATNSAKIIDQIGSKFTGLKSYLGQYQPNFLKSEDRQKYEQAQRDFVNSVLRRESGAVISPSEFDNAKQQYFPQPGDTAGVIEQKRLNRNTVIDGLMRAAGPAGTKKPVNIIELGTQNGYNQKEIQDAINLYGEDQVRQLLQQKKTSFNSGDTGNADQTPNSGKVGMRTDRHNNPTAFTTDIAKIAGLKEGVDYVKGDPFSNGKYFTAKLLKDPIGTTIKVIDKIGFYTGSGNQRWTHTAMPKSQWDKLSYNDKKKTIAKMYQAEGGKALTNIFG